MVVPPCAIEERRVDALHQGTYLADVSWLVAKNILVLAKQESHAVVEIRLLEAFQTHLVDPASACFKEELVKPIVRELDLRTRRPRFVLVRHSATLSTIT
jgi:GMP synthase PP-ATPase subunit